MWFRDDKAEGSRDDKAKGSARKDNNHPRVVEGLEYTIYGITFRTGDYFGYRKFPWRNINVDLYLSGPVQHEIKLKFGRGNLAYQVTHNSEAPHSWVRDHDVDRAGRGEYIGDRSSSKRKASFGDDAMPSGKRVRFH